MKICVYCNNASGENRLQFEMNYFAIIVTTCPPDGQILLSKVCLIKMLQKTFRCVFRIQ